MTNTTGHIYFDKGEQLPFEKIYSPTDHWSSGDRAMLISAVALGSFLAAAGTLGILAHLGKNVGPFQALTKLEITPYALGAFGGAGLLVTTLALSLIKLRQDAAEVAKIKKIITERPNPTATPKTTDPTPLTLLAIDTARHNEAFTSSRIRQYHVIYTQGNVYLYANERSALAKEDKLVHKGFQPYKVFDEKHHPNALNHNSQMDRQVEFSKLTQEDATKFVKRYVSHPHSTRKCCRCLDGYYQEVQVTYKKWMITDGHSESYRNRVPKDRLRLGFGVSLLALSIAAIVVPIFVRFPMRNMVQTFGIGSSSVLLYGAVSGILLKKRSEEFITKGHDASYRKVSYGISHGISRNALAALFSGALIAIAGCVIQKYTINPLFIAPPMAVGAVAILAYAHFKGRETQRRWNRGTTFDLHKVYEEGVASDTVVHERNSYDRLHKVKSCVLSDHIGNSRKRLIIDLKDIQKRTAFEGAKKAFNLAGTLLPLLALIIIVALVGTRVFLAHIPKRIV